MTAPGTETAVFAGGCFWGVDAVFKHVKGVVQVVSGYAGGRAETADYESVSTGTTGHAESVEVTFDTAQITYTQLLEIFFAVAHDPTQLNRQGPDEGTQYRSAIFYTSAGQAGKARAYIEAMTRAHEYAAPIVTQVVALNRFYPAEAYHQDYLAHHLTQPYIVYNDLPKLRQLRERFPQRYRP
jgi:peptide-methionine (S)-S-oxide reductase